MFLGWMGLISLLAVLAPVALVGEIKIAIQKWEKHRKDRMWKSMPQKANGTLITGALGKEEIAKAVSATIPIDKIGRKAMALMPTEIWRLIIYHATESYPTPFSVREYHVASPTAKLSEQELYQLYRQSIRIKLKLSRVSHAWKLLTKEFLFEFVWITSLRGANALGRLLMEEADAGRTLAESSGWWIRKLWLDGFPPNNSPRHTVRVPEAEYNYPPLISKCPRLIHYRHRASCKKLSSICVATLAELVCQSRCYHCIPHPFPPSHPLDAAAADHDLILPFTPDIASQNHNHGLILLDWSDSHPWSLATHLERHSSVLSHSIFASLESLNIRASCCIPPRTKGKGKCIVLLPKLHTLSASDPNGLADLTDWELPALRSLYLVDTYRGVDYLEPFLRVHGAKIETFEIQGLGSKNRIAWQLDVAGMCPNLEALHLSFEDLGDWLANCTLWRQTSSSSIKRLGLFGLEDCAVRLGPHADRFCETNWEGKLPALEILQDMSIESDRLRRRALEHPGLLEARPHIAFWKMLVRVLGDKGVTLLDWDGGPVVI